MTGSTPLVERQEESRTERLIALVLEQQEGSSTRELLLDRLYAHRRATWEPVRVPARPRTARIASRAWIPRAAVRALGETLQAYALAPPVFEPSPVPGRPGAA